MKFFTLALFVASSALALSKVEKREDAQPLENYDYSYLGINPIFPIKKECNDALKKYNEYEDCYINLASDLTTINIQDFCKSYSSDKCQKFYQLKVSSIPECQSSEKISVLGIDYLLKINYLIANVECAVDENNNLCPYNEFELLKKMTENMTLEQEVAIAKDSLNDTCKSAQCSTAYINYFDELNKIKEEFLKLADNHEQDASVTTKVKREVAAATDFDVFSFAEENITYLKSAECAALRSSSPAPVNENPTDSNPVDSNPADPSPADPSI